MLRSRLSNITNRYSYGILTRLHCMPMLAWSRWQTCYAGRKYSLGAHQLGYDVSGRSSFVRRALRAMLRCYVDHWFPLCTVQARFVASPWS